MPPRPRPSRAPLAAIALLLAMAATSPADNIARQPGVIRAQDVAQLGAEDFAVREAATRGLLADDALTPAAVIAAMPHAGAVEQRHRLIDIARHHFLRTVELPPSGQPQRGAIGMQLMAVLDGQDTGNPRAGVRVAAVFPGFPAYVHLRVGDVITAIDGQMLDPSSLRRENERQFNALVQSHAAGDTLRLTLWRDGAALEVSLKLTSLDRLNAISQTGNPHAGGIFHEQWEHVMAQCRNAMPPAQPLTLPAAPVAPSVGESPAR